MRLEDMTPEDKAKYGFIPLSREDLKVVGQTRRSKTYRPPHWYKPKPETGNK